MKKIYSYLACLMIFSSCVGLEEKDEILTLASGRVERIENFESAFIPARNVDVWLPDGYSSNKKYAVLYMHDGQMLFDSTRSWNQQEWGVDETLGRLLASGDLRETIVVGIWNTEFRHSEYFPQKPFESLPTSFQDSLLAYVQRNPEAALFKKPVCSDDYLRFIVQELKPYMDSTYATRPEKENTFIAGSSMGGLISMYAICEYPEVFQAAGCLSTHWVGIFDTVNNPIPQQFASYLDQHLPSPEHHRIYFDYGTETLDAWYEPYQLVADSIMRAHGYDAEHWTTRKFPGEDHSERAWNRRLSIPLRFLLGQQE
ncbi:MAG: alpha/beta hydrolase-fold protein [Bacteroidota bacterium]